MCFGFGMYIIMSLIYDFFGRVDMYTAIQVGSVR